TEMAAPAEPERVGMAKVGWSSYTASVDCGTEPGYLVWSEAFYPGWSAQIDSRPSQIIRTNHAFQGVVVPPGSHVVTFHFQPNVFVVGLYFALVVWTIIAAGLAYGFAVRTSGHRFTSRRRGIGPNLVE